MEMVSMIKDPSRYVAMGAKIPRGLLMSGPSGTGKTLLAKAIAGETNCSFMSLAGSSFDEGFRCHFAVYPCLVYVGVGSSRVRKLFKEARQNCPCIIFIGKSFPTHSHHLQMKSTRLGAVGSARQTPQTAH